MNNKELADLLFPEITKTPEDIEKLYPSRPEWTVVTRMWPSPTWFLHIWAIYSAFIDERVAHQNNGVVFLRIEDTDQKREVEWAAKVFVDTFKMFGIKFNEWPIGENYSDIGNYGPYTQSLREEIYKVFVKDLVLRWLAYPCFMTTDEINEIRTSQEKAKVIPGIYGQYSKWRDASFDDVKKMYEQGRKFEVIRLKSPALLNNKIKVQDIVRWEIETLDNYIDIVILKSIGLPTYHFAHIVDDHLMWTTHVIRSDEWLASLPLHMQMFNLMGWKAPQYAHYAPIEKLDGSSRRKLSKRKDQEADVQFYFKLGFPVEAILEYLANIFNSWFEDWKAANPDKDVRDFDFKLEKMSVSWALLDMLKVEHISTEYISRLDINTLYNRALEWAKVHEPYMAELMEKHVEYTKAALNIERWTPTDPKRFHKFSDISSQLMFFYDEEYQKILADRPTYPENITDEVMEKFIEDYIENFSLDVSKDEWFEQLKNISKKYGFAWTNAEFKAWWFIWRVWDIAMLFRIILCWSKTTPDLYETMKVMWKERIINRLKYAVL